MRQTREREREVPKLDGIKLIIRKQPVECKNRTRRKDVVVDVYIDQFIDLLLER